MSFLDILDVSKVFGGVKALDRVTFRVESGSRNAIVGPSGSGKTTLLRIIAGFEAPDRGRVVLDGDVLADASGTVPAHRRRIGIVAQDGALFPHLTISDNIGFGLPRRERGRGARIAGLMDMVGLDAALLERKPDQLSGGQQQRVALARAMALRPRLMLLDEPFSALDTGLRAETRKAVATLLRHEGITAILVTHDQEEALSFADQVAVMSEGRLLQAGTPHDLYHRPATPMIATFLGEAIVLPAEVADGRALCALGRIGVADRHRRGPAIVMLRPEQIHVRLDQASAATPETGVLGEILSIEFSGPVSTLELRLLDHSGGLPLRLRTARAQLPRIGEIARVTVEGEAHLFPDVSATQL